MSRKPLPYKMSKSSFVRGMQCPKLVFLDKYRKDFRTPPSPDTLAAFHFGREFERKVKNLFPEAFDMQTVGRFPNEKYLQTTQELLQLHPQIVILEAGILHNEVAIMTDILRKNADGSFDVFEVKASSHVNVAMQHDIALQYYVCRQQLGNIRSFNIVTRNPEDDSPVFEDMTSYCECRWEEIESRINEFKGILGRPEEEPAIEMGPQCETPYMCDFRSYCLRRQREKED